MNEILGVGIIGASADRGWAKISHVPAVQSIAGLELAAVASGTQEKGDAAAKAFGAKRGYGSGMDLIQDPGVNIVAICVKVPDHRELVLAALSAGKHIYCEWPLGRNLEETKELAAAAQASAVHVAIGLQTRMNQAAREARRLIESGAIGRILSARILSETAAFGPKVESAMAFGEDAQNGVTLVTIQGAHTLDTAIAVLGPFSDISALATTQYPEVEIGDDPAPRPRATADHLLAQARLAEGGGAVSIEVAGGRPPDSTPFDFTVTGESGSLTLHGGAMRGFQSGVLQLTLNGKPQNVDNSGTGELPETAVNVTAMYAALRGDIVAGASTIPDFAHAVRLNQLVYDAISSSGSGSRASQSDWPVNSQ